LGIVGYHEKERKVERITSVRGEKKLGGEVKGAIPGGKKGKKTESMITRRRGKHPTGGVIAQGGGWGRPAARIQRDIKKGGEKGRYKHKHG